MPTSARRRPHERTPTRVRAARAVPCPRAWAPLRRAPTAPACARVLVHSARARAVAAARTFACADAAACPRANVHVCARARGLRYGLCMCGRVCESGRVCWCVRVLVRAWARAWVWAQARVRARARERVVARALSLVRVRARARRCRASRPPRRTVRATPPHVLVLLQLRGGRHQQLYRQARRLPRMLGPVFSVLSSVIRSL
jgi:hypothetical protein